MGLNQRQHYVLRTRIHRVSTANSFCLLLISVLVMAIGFVGGLCIYRLLTQPLPHRGYCRIPFQGGRVSTVDRQGLGSPVFTIPVEGMSPQSERMIDDGTSYFQEGYELDVDEDRYSELEVPDFENGREGRFIHEFDSNQTAIVDINAKRCFIMPLDRERIMEPRNLFDVIMKMHQGLFNLNTTIIRQTMRVNPEPLEDLSEVGYYIRQKCANKAIYRLEKMTSRIVKREAGSGIDAKPFVEFSGTGLLAYDIVNLNELKNPVADISV